MPAVTCSHHEQKSSQNRSSGKRVLTPTDGTNFYWVRSIARKTQKTPRAYTYDELPTAIRKAASIDGPQLRTGKQALGDLGQRIRERAVHGL